MASRAAKRGQTNNRKVACPPFAPPKPLALSRDKYCVPRTQISQHPTYVGVAEEYAVTDLALSQAGAIWNYRGQGAQGIYAYNIATGQTRQVYADPSTDMLGGSCDIDGSQAVWTAPTSSSGPRQVFLYDFHADAVTQLTAGEDSAETALIDGSQILFSTRGPSGVFPTVESLLCLDLSSGQTITLGTWSYSSQSDYTAHGLRQYDISGQTVVWSAWDGGDFEVYMTTVPEPTTLWLAALAASALARRGNRLRRRVRTSEGPRLQHGI